MSRAKLAKPHYVRIKCPGCGHSMFLPIRGPAPDGPSWEFNGDLERPTLSPSILQRWSTWEPPVTTENHAQWEREPWPQTKVDHVCHSFVRDGRIEFLADCTHALAGQTVDLPEIADA
jgi:hypothetical protein